MIVGIDIGGTNTDAVLLKEFRIARKVKSSNEKGGILPSVTSALGKLLESIDPREVTRVVVSTTLSTNSIVEGRLEEAGMIVAGGPGLDASLFSCGSNFHLVKGALDHRGRELLPLDEDAVKKALGSIKDAGGSSLGTVTKFSTRNPSHELAIRELSGRVFPFVSMGHLLSGTLNFPRRIATAFLNASVWRLHREFTEGLEKAAKGIGITAPLFVLKADGGTMKLDASSEVPVYTILSGLAASIMGLLALTEEKSFLGLDMGGTTTDISLFHKGSPLFQPHGITLGGHLTLVRGLLSQSIGIGGDSEVTFEGPCFKVGPLRKGLPMCLGGPAPALTDALMAGGAAAPGSREKAQEAMARLAGAASLSPDETPQKIIRQAASHIAAAARTLVNDVNSRPVYTIHELIKGEHIIPESAVAVGGPAEAMAPWLEEALGMPVLTPRHFEVANALGASLARITAEITLIADTERGYAAIAEDGFYGPVERGARLREMEELAASALVKKAIARGASESDVTPDFLESQEFSMVRGYSTAGRTIRVMVQTRPGLTGSLIKEESPC
ncbi:MAG: hydantoinase/oxoprolinase family protein [Candidatus Eremiobacteraeota bacterium]|nr:hydantoinase/oxoprolinase family protein [Candidatus Eremiobacteraeota bacterium]